jgi:hypothetical protein
MESGELALVACLDQRTDEICSAGEEHTTALFRCFNAQRDGEMSLSGADRPGEDEIFATTDPLTACQLRDGGWADGTIGCDEIKAIESLGLRETRVMQRGRTADSSREACSAASTSWRESS